MSGSNNAIGSTNVNQNINAAGDDDQLDAVLREAGLSDDQVADLHRALESDGDETNGDEPGPAVAGWLATVREQLTSSSFTLVMAYLMTYLGLTPPA